MRDNIADSILNRINTRIGSVSNRLSVQYKGVKPFDAQEVKPEDQLFWYEQLGVQDMDYVIEKYGRDRINQFVFESEQIKARRKTNA